MDNGIQFTYKHLKQLLKDLKVNQYFTSLEHPWMNKQVEVVNHVILKGLNRIIDSAKWNWADELSHVLWEYRTTPYSTMLENTSELALNPSFLVCFATWHIHMIDFSIIKFFVLPSFLCHNLVSTFKMSSMMSKTWSSTILCYIVAINISIFINLFLLLISQNVI